MRSGACNYKGMKSKYLAPLIALLFSPLLLAGALKDCAEKTLQLPAEEQTAAFNVCRANHKAESVEECATTSNLVLEFDTAVSMIKQCANEFTLPDLSSCPKLGDGFDLPQLKEILKNACFLANRSKLDISVCQEHMGKGIWSTHPMLTENCAKIISQTSGTQACVDKAKELTDNDMSDLALMTCMEESKDMDRDSCFKLIHGMRVSTNKIGAMNICIKRPSDDKAKQKSTLAENDDDRSPFPKPNPNPGPPPMPGEDDEEPIPDDEGPIELGKPK